VNKRKLQSLTNKVHASKLDALIAHYETLKRKPKYVSVYPGLLEALRTEPVIADHLGFRHNEYGYVTYKGWKLQKAIS
jgi:hypothetical protein